MSAVELFELKSDSAWGACRGAPAACGVFDTLFSKLPLPEEVAFPMLVFT